MPWECAGLSSDVAWQDIPIQVQWSFFMFLYLPHLVLCTAQQTAHAIDGVTRWHDRAVQLVLEKFGSKPIQTWFEPKPKLSLWF